MKKRLLAMVLTVAMCLSLLPVSALATGATGSGTPTVDDNGLILSKSAVANDDEDKSYTLTMEAYTTGTVVSTTNTRPCDIVLVLDESSSMQKTFSEQAVTYTPVYTLNQSETYYYDAYYYAWGSKILYKQNVTYCSTCNSWTTGCTDGWGWHQAGTKVDPKTSADDTTQGRVQFYQQTTEQEITRLDAMKSAAIQFVNQVAEQNGDHQIAIVGFGNAVTSHSGFVDAKTNVTQLTSAINEITKLENATEHGKGLEQAKNLIQDASDNKQKVVVLFTDGAPEPAGESNWSARIVKQAIENAYSLKNTYSSSVYCISVLPDSDANMDKYMNAISSNYPSATYKGNGSEKSDKIVQNINLGNKAEEANCYLKAANILELERIFQKITTDVTTLDIELGSDAVLKDIVTPYFDIVDNSITVQEVPCTGVDKETGAYTWGTASPSTLQATKQSNTDGTTTVSVTGFNYDANFVSAEARTVGDNTDFHGKKLVVTVKVKPKTGFWGGNNVPTNTSDSGIYTDEDTLIENFPEPKVNVPLNVPDLEAQDLNIYCGNTAPNVMNLVTNVSVFTKATGDDAWKTEFVSFSQITATSTSVSNTVDTACTFSVTVSPAAADSTSVGTAATDTIKTATGHVYVYVPTITFQDTTIEKGSTANYANNFVNGNTVWKHGTTVSTDVTMQGAMPTLDLTYDPDASAFESDTDVSVTAVENNSTDIKNYTTFAWQTNSASTGCGTGDGACAAAPENNHFRVHVEDPAPTTGNLTVTKTVGGADLPRNFKITVSGPNNYSQDLTLTDKTMDANNTYTWTINNLAPGSYTVSESNAEVSGYFLTATTNYGENAASANVTAGNSASVAITNTYSQVFGSLIINKVDSENSSTALDGATFSLTKNGETTATSIQTTDSSGTATFSNIPVGTYTLKETAAPTGYQLSDTEYTVTVMQTVNNATATVTVKDGSTPVDLDNGAMTIANTATPPATPDPATLTGSTDLKISKTFSGRDWKDSDEFTFTLTGSEGAPMPADATNNMSTITIGKPESGNTNTGHFDNIRYDEADTYTYTVREVPPEGVDSNNKLNGVTYDDAVYNVQVVVTESDGKLSATATYSEKVTDNEYSPVDAMTFTNSYSAAPVVVPGGDTEQDGSSEKIPGALKVSKNYNNWKDGDEFTFILTAKDKAPLPGKYETPGNADVTTGGEFTVNTSVSINATKDHQTVAFDDITFSKAGIYTYTVSEVEGSISGVTYDKTVYTVVITVTDTGAGELGYDVSYSIDEDEYYYTDAGAMTFTNTWKSTGGGGGGSHKPTLNTKDHYGYIIGYPVDYETGEKTTDQTRMPVKPQGNITRAEVATIFFRMLTDNSRNEFWSTTNAYSDVNDGQWFNNAISTLANAGILSGYPDGTFRPNAPITRAEFTKIAASFFEKVEYTMNNPFNDVDEDDWFYAFVMAAYEGGLITGYPEGDFRPTANITRAEAVTIVNRTLDRHPDQDHFLKDMLVWPDNMDTSKWYYADMQEATNSHEYVMKGSGDSKYENWTKMLEIRDWAAFEKEWSDANSAAGGEVSK